MDRDRTAAAAPAAGEGPGPGPGAGPVAGPPAAATGGWLPALLIATGLQAVVAMMTNALPVLGPAATAVAGVSPEKVGYLSALVSLGTMTCLLCSPPFLRWFGPVRMLQAGTLLAALALLCGASGIWAVLLLAAFLVGFGYAPSAPAGSEILLERAPARRRSLMFSIKQSGVPMGGALAGLALPVLLVYGGLPWALGGCALIGVLAIAAVQPWRAAIDGDRVPVAYADMRIRPSALVQPFRTALSQPRIAVLTCSGFSMAIAQGALFTFLVTFLHEATDYPLTWLGAAFAVMQGVGVVSRVGMGWVADRVGSARRVLTVLAFGSGGMMMVLTTIGDDWPWIAIVTVSALCGLAVASWNGVLLGEVAASAPEGRVGEATAGNTFCVFGGYVMSPIVVSLVVTATGSYPAGLLVAAVPPLLAGVLLLAVGARERRAATGEP